jgi:hypothetical protein
LARIGRQQMLSRCNQVGKWRLPISYFCCYGL